MKSSSKSGKNVDIHQLASFLRGVELLNGLSADDLARVSADSISVCPM
jgi:hypothetical protein